MKKYYFCGFILFFFLVFTGCSSKKELLGNWETVALIKEGQINTVIDSNIKFVLKNDALRTKGCAGVNLYQTNVKIKGKNIKFSEMENTGFMGNPDEMRFEDLFFSALMNAETYKIKNNLLILYVPAQNMELHLKHGEK